MCLVYQTLRYSSSVSDDSKSSDNKAKVSIKHYNILVGVSGVTDHHRAMTPWDRVLHFPEGVRMLWKDWLLYRNICDASTTPRNAWSNQQGQPFSKINGNSTNQIPWRQREQQRTFIDAVSTVLPVVLLWCVPVIGYIPMFVAIAAPRQLLSRHFHNSYEVRFYNEMAFLQRKEYFSPTVACFWNITFNRQLMSSTTDPAGPLLEDPISLYEDFVKQTNVSSVHSLSSKQLINFTLAIGIFSSLPPKVSTILAFKVVPLWWLRSRVKQVMRTIVDNDHALLRLRQKEDSLGPNATFLAVVFTLSDVEVMDACLMRGLPIVDLQYDDMRRCLANHLQMIADLKEDILWKKIGNGEMFLENEEQFGLFILILPIVRDYFKQSVLTSRRDKKCT
jgi:hypothetical protein